MNLKGWSPVRSNLPEIAALAANRNALTEGPTLISIRHLGALPVSLLPGSLVKATIHHWWLSLHYSHEPLLTIEGLDGVVVRTSSGRTSTVTTVDPASRRVLTRSGSVYQLGMPEVTFAAKARLVLKALGF